MIIYNFIKNLYLNVKYTNIIRKIYKSERLIEHLSELFGATFREDRIHRLYAVLNPNIVNGKYDATSQVFEYGESGLNNESYIEKWIMDRMNAANQFIHVNNLFELLTYDIKKLDDYGNFLFIIKPITLDDYLNSAKKFAILISVLSGLGLITFMVLSLMTII